MTRLLAFTAALTIAAATVGAQPPAAPAAAATDRNVATRSQIIDEMVARGVKAIQLGVPGGKPFQTTFGTGGDDLVAAFFVALHSERQGYRTLLDALEARADKQLGAAPAASGSTSLAMKGLVPDILGLAVETGALTRAVNGSTLTFRLKPSGVIKALQGQGLLDTYADYSNNSAARYGARFSASASFDISRGSTAGTFTAGADQLTGLSLRYELINDREPTAPEYAELWKGTLLGSKEYQDAAVAIGRALGCAPGADTWQEFCDWEAALTKAVDEKVDQQWNKDKNTSAAAALFKTILELSMPDLAKLPNQPAALTKALDAYVAQLTKLQASIGKVYDFVGKGLLLTADWTTARAASLPDLYTATGILETSLGAARKTDLTVNVAGSFYRERPASASSAFKSFDVTGQLDHPLGNAFVLPSATLTIAARYSYLPNDTAAAATPSSSDESATVAASAPKGSIGVLQGKLTVPIKGSGLKVPLSVTVSNRTELVKEKDVRGSIGITFDLDTFLTALSAKSR